MRVLSVNLGSDPAGISSALERAFAGTDVDFRSYCSNVNYIGYEGRKWDRDEIMEAWREADVVHLHHGFRSADWITRGYFGRILPKKSYVVHFHGTGYRENSEAHRSELVLRRAVGLVSTLDLHLLGGLEWLPSPVDVSDLEKRRVNSEGKVVIAHAPTNRGVKSTELFLDAVARLDREGYPVELELIERRPWSECLERKARADIFYDQVILGYGNNALEAWGMGIPVVAGAADETLDEMERRFGHLPFYHATEETIYDALKELVESPELRQRYGKIGQDYVRKFHDYPVVAKQLKGIYRRALGMQEEEAA